MKTVNSGRDNRRIRFITITALMAALASVLMLLEFSVPFMPSIIKLDFSELPALLSTVICGPFSGLLVCLIKNIIKLTTTQTGGVGELCNFLLGAALVLPVGLMTLKGKGLKRALIASLIGSVIMALCSLPINYFLTYPVYMKLFLPADAIVALYRAIYPGTKSLLHALIIFNMPFTLFKGLIDSALAIIVYRRLPSSVTGRAPTQEQ